MTSRFKSNIEAYRTLTSRHRDLFMDHNSRDIAQTTTAAKTSQNKEFN